MAETEKDTNRFIPIADVPDARRSHLFHPERVPVLSDPRFPWAGVALQNATCAWHFACLSHAVYHIESTARSIAQDLGWKLETRIERNGVRADLLHRDDHVLLCCCGTRPNEIRNLRHDIDATLTKHSSYGRVHRGFAMAWEALSEELRELPHPTLTTGHSLGGALAILAATEFPLDGTIVFGCPRVGDSSFNASIHKESLVRYRVTADMICHLPPERFGFEDAGRLALLAEGRRIFDLPHEEVAQYTRRGQLRFAKRLPWLHPSALWFRELADHAIHGYCHHLAKIIDQEN